MPKNKHTLSINLKLNRFGPKKKNQMDKNTDTHVDSHNHKRHNVYTYKDTFTRTNAIFIKWAFTHRLRKILLCPY